jgi:hypothetical protein
MLCRRFLVIARSSLSSSAGGTPAPELRGDLAALSRSVRTRSHAATNDLKSSAVRFLSLARVLQVGA